MENISAEYQRAVLKFVDQNVNICQTMLVEALFQSESISIDIEDIDNLYAMFESVGTGICNDCKEEKELNEDNACEDCQDNNAQEILEWWIVSNWLLAELREAGEPILDTNYGSWWGRTTSGQAISMDYTITKIYDAL